MEHGPFVCRYRLKEWCISTTAYWEDVVVDHLSILSEGSPRRPNSLKTPVLAFEMSNKRHETRNKKATRRVLGMAKLLYVAYTKL